MAELLAPLAALTLVSGLAVLLAVQARRRWSGRRPRPAVGRHSLRRPHAPPAPPPAPTGPIRLTPRRIEVVGSRPHLVPQAHPVQARLARPAPGWMDDPRRRLWRDTAGVLLIGGLAVLAAWSLTGLSGPRGAVLSVTATPHAGRVSPTALVSGTGGTPSRSAGSGDVTSSP